MKLPTYVIALRHRDFRIFWCGLVVSQTGVWMQNIAMSWLVYRLTGSVLMLGVVAFASQIPVLFLAPVGGLLADRFDRRRLILVTQAVAFCQATALTVLTLTHRVEPWHLVALALLLGTIYAVDTPVRQSLIARLIDEPRDLGNAITLGGMSFNLSRLVGPSLGGIVVAAWGEGYGFALNMLTYAVAIVFIWQTRTRGASQRIAVGGGLKAGFQYAFGTPVPRALVLNAAAVALFTLPYVVLLPYFAKNVFSGHADTLGVLMSALSVGGIIAAGYALSRRKLPEIPRIIWVSSVTFGIALLLFPRMPVIWMACLCLAVAGGCTFLIGNGSSSLIQSVVSDGLRGRMMSIFTMFWFGFVPVGSLVAGLLADSISPEHTVELCGLACIGSGLWFRRSLPHFEAEFRARKG